MADISFPDDGMSYIRGSYIRALRETGVSSQMVLDVMGRVPRHLFVSEALRYRAYDDISLPIGHGQTLSRPRIIGLMVQACALTGDESVLEVGTGSGYQTALLASLAFRVSTMERIPDLHSRAKTILFRHGFSNISFHNEENVLALEGTFDVIIVAAGALVMPEEYLGKLNPGGRLIIPVMEKGCHAIRRYVIRRSGEVICEDVGNATFVPLMREGRPV